MKMRLAEIGAAMQAVGDYDALGDLEVTRVQTDSRLVEAGDLFVCLPGERFDGHQFAGDAVQKGAVGVVAERPLGEMHLDAPVLLVPSCLEALGSLAGAWRRNFAGTVVAVTGSAGKTSLKEFLASALSQAGEVGKNYKNWNNQLGVPLSILGFSGREAFWVLEAGVNFIGEMDILGRIIQPDLGVINNIGPVHLEGLKSVRGVAREKALLLSHLQPGGWAVISSDYPELTEAAGKYAAGRTVCFSLEDDQGPYYGEYLGPAEGGGGRYRLLLRGRAVEVRLDYQGWFILENVLAAAATASEFGLGAETLSRGLELAELPEHRCRFERCGPFLLIDDCYNANPLSMRRAIDMAREAAQGSPFWVVLGDMKELGEQSVQEHEDLGRYLAGQGVGYVFYAGEQAGSVRRGFSESAPADRVISVQNEEDLVQGVQSLGLKGGTVLIKGSRGCRMERFVKVLTGGFAP